MTVAVVLRFSCLFAPEVAGIARVAGNLLALPHLKDGGVGKVPHFQLGIADHPVGLGVHKSFQCLKWFHAIAVHQLPDDISTQKMKVIGKEVQDIIVL